MVKVSISFGKNLNPILEDIMSYDDWLLFYARKGWGRPLRESAYRKFCRRNRDKQFVTITQMHFPIKTIIGDTVDNSLYIYGVFERGTTKIIDRIGPDCDGLIDVGCNIGYFSCLFGVGNPGKPIVAIDPNPAMIQRTEENLKLNEIKYYELLPFGIGAKREKLKLNISKLRHSLSSFAYVPKTGLDEQIDVDVVPLSEVFRNLSVTSALLKIDAEGFEYQIFNGIDENTLEKTKYIVFELSMKNILQSGVSPESLCSLPLFRYFDVYRINDGDVKITRMKVEQLVSDPETEINVLMVKKGSSFEPSWINSDDENTGLDVV